MDVLARWVSGRISAWIVLAVAVVTSVLVVGIGGSADTVQDEAGGLPRTADSAQVAELRKQLPSGRENPALVVYRRDGGLTPADRAAIDADRTAFAATAAGEVSPVIPSEDGTTALVTVPLPVDAAGADPVDAVAALRAQTRDGLPAGLVAQVTGGAAFGADIASSFEGANVSLLLVTVIVVAVLLIVTYRSPVLWLVPLAVVGTADVVANSVIALLSRYAGLDVGPSTIGIADVLVFGAGTNYALLLIARYREELHRHADRREALRAAWRGASPAVAASAATVVLSLLMLGFADLQGTRAIGYASAAGIGIAALFGLLVLPAALVVCGRGLFWPFVPRYSEAGDAGRARGAWYRVGRFVAGRPRTVAAAAVALLALLAVGLTGTQLGLSRAESFRVQAESIDGLETLGRAFPAGAADPVVVISTAGAADAVRAAAEGTPGVAAARPGSRGGDRAETVVTLEASPDTPESYSAVRALRERVAAVPGGEALVGGEVATNLDTRDAAARDLRVVVPLVLAVVVLVLLVLLRSVVAAIALVLTVVGTYFAALGAGVLAFDVFGFAGLDVQVPLLAFIFLVALGVDYNIFLATRAREETPERGTREGMVVALAATGGVITSAGILLAAVFAVLGVLPLITLTEIGVIVGLGVLLDTLVVRTLLVPAIATLLGRRFWWPSRLDADRA
ncbi:MMPL family transporter [Spirilliplanes yamanashiensis]|uniref:Membrane protein n=1 Tax=Spirilliplanes yamanashiensis TaxID=42233 RepID=A0A8J3Y9L9_9ACTN|nr:MMPL family transporter [Spirilliplanes yamanashiensis]MDP9817726.1 RND superfamily putative drug exporter [Spirilliplanes yamanashiensis]GIJ04536.1 membrane protein [Spirilliplanes yamanashiensis]